MKRLIIAVAMSCIWIIPSGCGSGGPDAGDCFLESAALFLQDDGSLVLTGSDSLLLGGGSCSFPRICVSEDASLRVRGSTSIALTGGGRTVIGGTGIGPEGDEPALIQLDVEPVAEVYLLIENQLARVDLILNAVGSSAWIAITGQAGLFVDGDGADTTTYGWNPSEPPSCE